MATVDCGRADCAYNNGGICDRSKITLRSGRCKMYLEKFDTLRLMNTKPQEYTASTGNIKAIPAE